MKKDENNVNHCIMYPINRKKWNPMSDKNKTYKLNQSLDNLNEYIHVINPGVWLLLIAMLSIVGGIVCWGVFGRVDRKIETTIYVENKQVVCYVNHEESDDIKEGMEITSNDIQGTIGSLKDSNGGVDIYIVSSKKEIEDGYYQGSIIVEQISPISFLLD